MVFECFYARSDGKKIKPKAKIIDFAMAFDDFTQEAMAARSSPKLKSLILQWFFDDLTQEAMAARSSPKLNLLILQWFLNDSEASGLRSSMTSTIFSLRSRIRVPNCKKHYITKIYI